MRCEEIRRAIDKWSQTTDVRALRPEIRAHVATCPECALHLQAHTDLMSALSDARASVHTDGMPLLAVRSLVEERVARTEHTHSWSTLMTRMAGYVRRPVYWIPTIVAVAALLALTLFPWKVDHPGSYRVAFAGVDKDLALQEYGVQRVLNKLGISGAQVKVGDCDAACNLTISDLQSESDVGKVMSVMFKLSDCELLEVEREGDIELNLSGPNTFTFGPEGNVVCEFTNELSDDDLETIEVVVREVQFGSDSTSFWTSADGHSIFLMRIDTCATNEFVSGDTMLIRFDMGDCVAVTPEDGNSGLDGEGTGEMEFDQQSKVDGSNGPISGFQLSQNYPNPFNAGTTISFTAPPGGGQAALEVYNIRGQLVKTLVNRDVSEGTHQFTWDGRDSDGNTVASGVYLYRLTAGEYVETRKMSLLK